MKTSTSATSLGETSTSSRQAESVFGFCLGLPSCSPSYSCAVDVSLIWRIFFSHKIFETNFTFFFEGNGNQRPGQYQALQEGPQAQDVEAAGRPQPEPTAPLAESQD